MGPSPSLVASLLVSISLLSGASIQRAAEGRLNGWECHRYDIPKIMYPTEQVPGSYSIAAFLMVQIVSFVRAHLVVKKQSCIGKW